MRQVLTALAFSAALLAAPASAQMAGEGLMPTMVTHGDLVIQNPWTRATPAGAPAAGAYFTVTNNGAAPDRLLSAATPLAREVQLHEMRMEGEVMMMAEAGDGAAIGPGETVIFGPAAFHVMLVGLTRPIVAGETIAILLAFERAGTVVLDFPAAPIGGGSPYASGMGGGHAADPMPE